MPNLARGTAQCSFDTGATYGTITPSIDTANFNMSASDCVVANKGDMFTLQQTQGSLVVSFTSGSQARIGGAFFLLKSSASVTLQANQEQYICLTIDKGQQDGYKADITLKSLSQIQRGALYGGGSVRDLPIYKITASTSTITSITDMRKIVGNVYDVTESEYETLTKENYAIYNIYED